jgi:hypothetical protein
VKSVQWRFHAGDGGMPPPQFRRDVGKGWENEPEVEKFWTFGQFLENFGSFELFVRRQTVLLCSPALFLYDVEHHEQFLTAITISSH